MIEKLISEGAKKDLKLEVFKTKSESVDLKTFNKTLENFVISKSENFKIKSVYKNKNINLYTSNLNDTTNIINTLIKDSTLSDNKEKTEFSKPFKTKAKELQDLNLDFNEIKKFFLELDSLKKEYPFLNTIISFFYYAKKESEIINSEVNLKDNNQFIVVGFELVIKKGKKTETAYLEFFDKTFNKNKIETKLRKKITATYDKLNSKVPTSMKTNVLITNDVMAGILDRFLGAFFAKKIRLKQSPFVDKLNARIFSEKITIVEDPANPDMIVSALFDPEGTKTYYKEIVKDGIFKTILYDNKEAILAKTKSTGNSDIIENCYIKPGEKSFDELIKELKDGIIIDRVDGLNAGIKVLTGDISLQCQGYIVKNGKISDSIKMFVMTTNIFELLSNVIEVGNDLENTGSTTMSPSILINDINISGQ